MPSSYELPGSAEATSSSRSAVAEPEIIRVTPKGLADGASTPSTATSAYGRHGVVEMVGDVPGDVGNHASGPPQAFEPAQDEKRLTFMESLQRKRHGMGQYVKTKEFWMVLILGQVLSLALTGQNTLSGLLSQDGVIIPAFQVLFNYVLLNLIYTSYTLYKYGLKGWARMVWKDGWKYFLLAFVDSQGNYFVILAYKYTTILSCSLLDFWAIVVVMLISLIFLKVRYHLFQYVGIIVAIGGLGIILGSDHITHYNQYPAADAVKGDLFMLLGASFYGVSNVLQEFFVSKKPLYEVLGQLSFWAMFISGIECAIFNREDLKNAVWKDADGGYIAGFTLLLSFFYSLAPILFRMSSAAFFNISLLTSDFWAVIVGVQAFHIHVHWMYPIAFVCIVLGLLLYFVTEGVMGDSHKPWLGENQEMGVSGVGTAKRRMERRGNIAEAAPVPGVV